MLFNDGHNLAEQLKHYKGLRPQAPWNFEIETAERLLCQQFHTKDLSGFGCGHLPVALGAAGLPVAIR